ncbi:MAG: hypothetical protein V1708_00345 [Candidatus Micrarchaeota archaeon]
MFESEVPAIKVAQEAWKGDWRGKRVMGLYHVFRDENHVAVLWPSSNEKNKEPGRYFRWIFVFPKPELFPAIEDASYGAYGRGIHNRKAVGTILVERTHMGLQVTEAQAHYKLTQKEDFEAFPVLSKENHDLVKDWNTTGFKLGIWLAHRKGLPFSTEMKYAEKHPGIFVGIKKAAKQLGLPTPRISEGLIDKWYSVQVPQGKGRASRHNL